MDSIQKVLIKAGRKDLAQEYYKRIANVIIKKAGTWSLPDSPAKIEKLKKILNRLNVDGLLLNDLYNIIGDDDLFDNISKHFDKIRIEIKKKLSEFIKNYEESPDDFRGKLDVKELKKLV